MRHFDSVSSRTHDIARLAAGAAIALTVTAALVVSAGPPAPSSPSSPSAFDADHPETIPTMTAAAAAAAPIDAIAVTASATGPSAH